MLISKPQPKDDKEVGSISPSNSWKESKNDHKPQENHFDIISIRRVIEIENPNSISLAAVSCPLGNQLLAMYCSNDYFVFRLVKQNSTPLFRSLKWNKKQEIMGMEFDKSGQWLLCSAVDFSLFLIPAYFLCAKPQHEVSAQFILQNDWKKGSTISDILVIEPLKSIEKKSKLGDSCWWHSISLGKQFAILIENKPSLSWKYHIIDVFEGSSSATTTTTTTTLEPTLTTTAPSSGSGNSGSVNNVFKGQVQKSFILSTSSAQLLLVKLEAPSPSSKDPPTTTTTTPNTSSSNNSGSNSSNSSNGGGGGGSGVEGGGYYWWMIVLEYASHSPSQWISLLSSSTEGVGWIGLPIALPQFNQNDELRVEYLPDKFQEPTRAVLGVYSSKTHKLRIYDAESLVEYSHHPSKALYPLYIYQYPPLTNWYSFHPNFSLVSLVPPSPLHASLHGGDPGGGFVEGKVYVLANLFAGTSQDTVLSAKKLAKDALLQQVSLGLPPLPPPPSPLSPSPSPLVPSSSSGMVLKSCKGNNSSSGSGSSSNRVYVYGGKIVYEIELEQDLEKLFWKEIKEGRIRGRGASAEWIGQACALDLLQLYEQAADSLFSRSLNPDYGGALELYYMSNVTPLKIAQLYLGIGRLDIVFLHLKTLLRSSSSNPSSGGLGLGLGLLSSQRKKLCTLFYCCYLLQYLLDPPHFLKEYEEELMEFIRTNKEYDVEMALRVGCEGGFPAKYLLEMALARHSVYWMLELFILHPSILSSIDPPFLSLLQKHQWSGVWVSYGNSTLFELLPVTLQFQVLLQKETFPYVTWALKKQLSRMCYSKEEVRHVMESLYERILHSKLSLRSSNDSAPLPGYFGRRFHYGLDEDSENEEEDGHVYFPPCSVFEELELFFQSYLLFLSLPTTTTTTTTTVNSGSTTTTTKDSGGIGSEEGLKAMIRKYDKYYRSEILWELLLHYRSWNAASVLSELQSDWVSAFHYRVLATTTTTTTTAKEPSELLLDAFVDIVSLIPTTTTTNNTASYSEAHYHVLKKLLEFWKERKYHVTELEEFLKLNLVQGTKQGGLSTTTTTTTTTKNSKGVEYCLSQELLKLLHENIRRKFPLLLPFTPAFYLHLLHHITTTTTNNTASSSSSTSEEEGESHNSKEEGVTWIADVKENLMKDLDKRTVMWVPSISLPDLKPSTTTTTTATAPGTGGMMISFTCGHCYSHVKYMEEILPQFQQQLEGSGNAHLDISSKLLATEYYQQTCQLSCAVCLLTSILSPSSSHHHHHLTHH